MSLKEILEDKSKGVASQEKDVRENGLTFVGEGLPPLPVKTVLAIEKGEFVNLAELLPKNPGHEEPIYTELSENVVIVSQAKQMAKKRVISDITSWMEAFCTFAAIRGRRHPETIVDLMAYGALVVKGARDYGGSTWLSYDYQFRRLAAAKKLTTGWGKKDVALWNDAIIKPISTNPEGATTGKPLLTSSGGGLITSRGKGQRQRRSHGGQLSATPTVMVANAHVTNIS